MGSGGRGWGAGKDLDNQLDKKKKRMAAQA